MEHFTQTEENRLALTLQGIDRMTSELVFCPVSGFYEEKRLELNH